MEFTNTNDVLRAELQKVIDKARSNLAVTKSWVQNDGSTRRKKIDTTGRLWKSLQIGEIKEDKGVFSVEIFMEDYGKFIDQGVSGTRNKTPKPSPFSFRSDGVSRNMQTNIQAWMNKKRIRLRDAATGRFRKGSLSQRKGLSYVISRSIKRKGINQTFFFTKPLEVGLETLPALMADAIMKDIEKTFNKD